MNRAMLRPASAAACSILSFSSWLRLITNRLLSPVRGLRARFLPREALREMRLRGDITFSCNMSEPAILCQPPSIGIYKHSSLRTEMCKWSITRDYNDPLRFVRNCFPSDFSDTGGFVGGSLLD